MARRLFGGTSADAAEDVTGARVPGAVGTVYIGPSDMSEQVTDMTNLTGTPMSVLTADVNGMVPAFYGPDGVERLYVDFGAGFVSLVATDTGERLTAHESALDPHGDRQAAESYVDNQVGVPNGIAPLDSSGLVPLENLPANSPQAIASIPALLAEMPFYIAHRGSGMEYPEHTLAAYEAALTSGVKAIEVSAGVTADGVPVCMHDQTFDRTTTGTGYMVDMPYAALINTVKVDPGPILGQGWEDQPMVNLRHVLDRFMGRVVIFLEAKSNEAVPIIQQILEDYYPTANQSVVWKNFFSNPSLDLMKSRGFTIWGYMNPDTTDVELDQYDSLIDIWGVPSGMADARKAEIVARGKKVICWEVHRRSQRDTLVGLGVQGMMAAQYKWLSTDYQILTKDSWASAVKAPGDMSRLQYEGVRNLKYDGDGSVHFDVLSESALIGSCSLPSYPTNGYRVTFDMAFDGPVSTNEHAGVAFGKADDSIYQFSELNASGGYHMLIRGSGSLQLYTHTAGVGPGTQLALAASAPPVPGQYMSFQVDVLPSEVKVTRTDVTPNVTVSSTNTAYRGGYVHIHEGSISSLGSKPRWKNFTVNAL